MDVPDLRCLVAVAEAGTITGAAARLHVAQPAVSQRIRALERALGVQLLHRSSRGVAPTAAGAALVERARDVLARIEAAEQLMTRFVPDVDRRVRLGVPVGLPAETLDALVTTFRARHPQLGLRLIDLDTATQVVALRDGSLDVGLVREPVGDELDRLPLLAEPLGVVVREDDPLAAGDAVALADLADRPVIGWPRRSAPEFAEDIVAACRRAGFTPDIVVESSDVVGALGRVAAGFGVHWLPEPAFHRYAQGLPRLRWRPLAGAPLVMRTSAAWARHRLPGVAASALLAVVGELAAVPRDRRS